VDREDDEGLGDLLSNNTLALIKKEKGS